MPNSSDSRAHNGPPHKSRTVADWRELRRSLQTQNNIPALAYQSTSGEQSANVAVEKVYDHPNNLLKIKKRFGTSRSETHLDTRSGATVRSIEWSILPDGSSMMKDTSYQDEDKSFETVVVVAPSGELVRKVEREHVGARTIFQGQTEYGIDGRPATTINHHMDPHAGHMTRREQIIWRDALNKSSADNFLFNYAGVLIRFVRTSYGSHNQQRREEIQQYDPQSQKMTKLIRSEFDAHGIIKQRDSIAYTDSGEIIQRTVEAFQ